MTAVHIFIVLIQTVMLVCYEIFYWYFAKSVSFGWKVECASFVVFMVVDVLLCALVCKVVYESKKYAKIVD